MPQEFFNHLKEVTKELLKDQVCQSVLDVVAPKPVEQGDQQNWADIVQEAADKMVERRWDRPANRRSGFVDWLKWQQGVGEAADQLSGSLLDGTLTIDMFARLPVQRAALAYARDCYPVPKVP